MNMLVLAIIVTIGTTAAVINEKNKSKPPPQTTTCIAKLSTKEIAAWDSLEEEEDYEDAGVDRPDSLPLK